MIPFFLFTLHYYTCLCIEWEMYFLFLQQIVIAIKIINVCIRVKQLVRKGIYE